MEKGFQLSFNTNGRVLYTPAGKDLNGMQWYDFEATAYKFRLKINADEVKTVSEKVAREIMGDKKVDKYLKFIEGIELAYTFAKAEAFNRALKMYVPYETMSENFTQGFHYYLADGRANGRARTYINPAESDLDDIFKLIEM